MDAVRRLCAILWVVGLLTVGAAPPVAAQTGPGGAEVLWDGWGVPHVYGQDVESTFHGFGWSQMHAHGDLILRLYGQARGRAAEYWGETYLESDRLVHTVGIPDAARASLAAQPAEFRRSLEAFADGMNRYARAHPDRVADDVEVVLPVGAEDVLAHMQRVWFTFLTLASIEGAQVAGETDPPLIPPSLFGIPANRAESISSNAWAVGPSRSASGQALLLINPHLSWGDLYQFFEAHLVAPGLDAYGISLVGVPVLAMAFSERLGWAHTVNTIDAWDAYALTPAEGGYSFDGAVRPFEIEQRVLRVRGADGALRDEPLTIRRSVHGPVIAERNGAPVALRVPAFDVGATLRQWWDMARARDLGEFEGVLARNELPMLNAVYADRDGHILYSYLGRVPVRPSGDFRFWAGILPGNSSDTLWTRVHPYAELPRALDPPAGWVQNSNSPPWTATFPQVYRREDYPPYLSPWFMLLREQRGVRMLLEDAHISLEELVTYKHSTRSELADRLLDDLIPAARAGGSPLAAQAADVLAAWDRQFEAESRGAVLFAFWLQEIATRGQSPSPFPQMAGQPSLFATPSLEDAPLATPTGLSDPATAASALEAAAAQLQGSAGALDVPWGELFRLSRAGHDFPANGVSGDPLGVFRVIDYAPAPDGRFASVFGDTFIGAVEFATPLRAQVLTTYGNATQPGSPHNGDQLELAARKELRPAWLTRAEVEANLESRDSLSPAEMAGAGTGN